MDDGGNANALVRAGTLLAVLGNEPERDRVILIKDGVVARIAAAEDEAAIREELEGPVRVIDLSDKFVMPGFIDLHVHLTGQAGTGSKLDFVTKNAARFALTRRDVREENPVGRLYDRT